LQLLNACQNADGHGNEMTVSQCPDLSRRAHHHFNWLIMLLVGQFLFLAEHIKLGTFWFVGNL